MSAGTNDGGKLQQLLDRFGGWTALGLLSLALWTYQQDKVNAERKFTNIDNRFVSTEVAISRLNDGKVSREELKSVQEQWIRETQGLRQDIKESLNTIRSDLSQRLEYTRTK